MNVYVYILFTGQYDDRAIKEVFDTREGAEREIVRAALAHEDLDHVEIVEYEVSS